MNPPKKVGQTHNRKETGPREVVGLPGKRGRLPGDVSFAHPHPITLARTHLCSGWQPSVDEPPLSAWLPSTLGPPPPPGGSMAEGPAVVSHTCPPQAQRRPLRKDEKTMVSETMGQSCKAAQRDPNLPSSTFFLLEGGGCF